MGTLNPHFNLQQATSQATGYPPSPSATGGPEAPPSDRLARPGPSSVYSSAGVLGLPQLSPAQSSFAAATRPNTSSHSYSRSSPGVGHEQKYIPFSNPPETPKYGGTPSQKYFSPHTPTGGPSHSPLALADIRPRTELHAGDELLSPNSYLNDGAGIVQTTSSYLAPWAIYAYDWCNWPVGGGSGAGKMAICSYLEDPHNFVSLMHNASNASIRIAILIVEEWKLTCNP